ncbi:hypothetical protein K438DRAFT_1764344 [Mycena galopus ATCC 62051]|nr:hypothetical protein K438DRAFT_1764344 [Mycena galopus ATCC 62051]
MQIASAGVEMLRIALAWACMGKAKMKATPTAAHTPSGLQQEQQTGAIPRSMPMQDWRIRDDDGEANICVCDSRITECTQRIREDGPPVKMSNEYAGVHDGGRYRSTASQPRALEGGVDGLLDLRNSASVHTRLRRLLRLGKRAAAVTGMGQRCMISQVEGKR